MGVLGVMAVGGGLSIEPSLRKAIPDVVAGEGTFGTECPGGGVRQEYMRRLETLRGRE